MGFSENAVLQWFLNWAMHIFQAHPNVWHLWFLSFTPVQTRDVLARKNRVEQQLITIPYNLEWIVIRNFEKSPTRNSVDWAEHVFFSAFRMRVWNEFSKTCLEWDDSLNFGALPSAMNCTLLFNFPTEMVHFSVFACKLQERVYRHCFFDMFYIICFKFQTSSNSKFCTLDWNPPAHLRGFSAALSAIVSSCDFNVLSWVVNVVFVKFE